MYSGCGLRLGEMADQAGSVWQQLSAQSIKLVYWHFSSDTDTHLTPTHSTVEIVWEEDKEKLGETLKYSDVWEWGSEKYAIYF